MSDLTCSHWLHLQLTSLTVQCDRLARSSWRHVHSVRARATTRLKMQGLVAPSDVVHSSASRTYGAPNLIYPFRRTQGCAQSGRRVRPQLIAQVVVTETCAHGLHAPGIAAVACRLLHALFS